MEPLTAAELRRVDLLGELGDEELAAWLAVARPRELAVDELLAEQNKPSAGMHLLLDGRLESFVIEAGRAEPMGAHEAPTWIGAIAALTGGFVAVRMVAATPCRVATVSPQDFTELAIAQRSVFRRVMSQIRPVMARISSVESNRERLASLGTMAAGLAHELNNPAAASRRASADLAETLDALDSTLRRFVEAGVEREEAGRLAELQRTVLAQAAQRGPLGALDAADAEDELGDRLESIDGIEEPWRLAEPLAAAGVTAEWLDELSACAGPATAAAVEWIAASLIARSLASELNRSAAQISTLVGAVKTYTFMDRGAVVDTDVHEGLETTLTVLNHKLKHTTIVVVREYDRSLPTITVHGSELNQVWTNLLDNAISALGTTGTITITTRLDGGCVRVDITDDGPGIPAAVLERVFEPFFTTKGVGEGTGLGLDTARRIVVDRQRGSLTVDSEPGRTTFSTWIPLPGG